MTISELALSATLMIQLVPSERSVFPDHEVLVAYADQEVATAVRIPHVLPSGNLRVHVYTVYRNGVARSGGRTPAYSDEWVDFDCRTKTLRLFQSSFYRPNADTVEDRDDRAAFVFVEGNVLRSRQLEAACGNLEGPRYADYFLFMEAYGLNDGRTPRSAPGPKVQ